jgi:hypothetical protein
MQELKAERVRVMVGFPETTDARVIPVTIMDMESRRVKYQHVPRDAIEVMEGDKMGEWMAIYLPTAEQWTLVDYVSDMRKALKVVA